MSAQGKNATVAARRSAMPGRGASTVFDYAELLEEEASNKRGKETDTDYARQNNRITRSGEKEKKNTCTFTQPLVATTKKTNVELGKSRIENPPPTEKGGSLAW